MMWRRSCVARFPRRSGPSTLPEQFILGGGALKTFLEKLDGVVY